MGISLLGCNNFTFPLKSTHELEKNAPSFPSSHLIHHLSVCYIAAYGFLFLVSYTQLWMILYYQCKRFSFQTTFLFLCLFWCALRVILFTTAVCNVKLPKSALIYWVFFHLPVCLQFFIFCLLTLYYAQVSFRIRPEYFSNPRLYLYPLRCIFAFLVVVGFTVSLTTILVVFNAEYSKNNGTIKENDKTTLKVAICVNVIISDTLSLICAIMLTVFLIRVAKSPPAHTLLRSMGTTVCRSFTIGIGTVLLSLSSSMYDLVSLSSVLCDKTSFTALFWYFDPNEALDKFSDSQKWSFFAYVVTLFVWELAPLSLVVFLHKIDVNCCRRGLHGDLENSMTQHFRSPVFFYDNPRVYRENLTSSQKEEDSENTALLPSTSVVLH